MISISLLNFSFCLCIVFLISLNGFLCFLKAELLKTAILDSLSGISHVSVFGVSYWKITFFISKITFFHFKNYISKITPFLVSRFLDFSCSLKSFLHCGLHIWSNDCFSQSLKVSSLGLLWLQGCAGISLLDSWTAANTLSSLRDCLNLCSPGVPGRQLRLGGASSWTTSGFAAGTEICISNLQHTAG